VQGQGGSQRRGLFHVAMPRMERAGGSPTQLCRPGLKSVAGDQSPVAHIEKCDVSWV
jgi:hypothetical protein